MCQALKEKNVHGIVQANILKWVDISFSRGYSLTQGSNLGLPHYSQILYCLNHQRSPKRGTRDFMEKMMLEYI